MEGLADVIVGIFGGGGAALGLAKYIDIQHKARIADLKEYIAKVEARATKAEETVLIAVQILPAIEEHLNREAHK